PRSAAPVLRVGQRAIAGVRTDSAGRFWSFDLTGLAPDTEHELTLLDGPGGGRGAGRGGGARGGASRHAPLLDPWPLRTFPAPGAEVGSVRLLIYTCAGGYQGLPEGAKKPAFLPLATRQRLLRRALS